MKHFYLLGLALLLSWSALAQRRGTPAPVPPQGIAAKVAPGGGVDPPVYVVPEQTP